MKEIEALRIGWTGGEQIEDSKNKKLIYKRNKL